MSELASFENLWDNHPDVAGGEHNPCDLEKFPDQCTIRLGVSMVKSGIDTSKLRGINHLGNMANLSHCWGEGHAKSEGHAFRAEDLARALEHTYIQGIHKVEKIDAKDFNKKLLGKTGVIFFKDYWRRERPDGTLETFKGRSGDHIDLWNGSRLTSISSWARIQMHLSWEGQYSDFYDSKKIWFWAIN